MAIAGSVWPRRNIPFTTDPTRPRRAGGSITVRVREVRLSAGGRNFVVGRSAASHDQCPVCHACPAAEAIPF